MAYRLGSVEGFAAAGIDEPYLRLLLDEHRDIVVPGLERLWTYYRNPTRSHGSGAAGLGGRGGSGAARGAGVGGGVGVGGGAGMEGLGQEIGLPSRITGRSLSPGHASCAGEAAGFGIRREVVIENDIAWRIQSMVDFMFGKAIRLTSRADDESTRAAVQAALDAVWEHSGGIALLQDAALIGHVLGSVDFLVNVDTQGLRDLARGSANVDSAVWARELGGLVTIEVVDPRRGLAVTDPSDYRRILAYIVHYEHEQNRVEPTGWLERAAESLGGRGRPPKRARTSRTRIIAADAWQQYEGERLIAAGQTPWTGGRVPVAHVQNIAEPWKWAGLGEVEPLMGLQDELNTRLSDRANRVTMQSFRMYLAKGVEGFEKTPIAPGQVWTTDNMDASIQAFGGDAASPSEDAHIQQIREAMDKVSGVPPVAGGVVQGRIGNLSSANALRVTLMSVLAKTARKRVTYGRGIQEVCGLVLSALDFAGLLRTGAAERAVTIEWPDPLPVDDREKVLAAEGKTRLGVSKERVLSELGYSQADAGVE